MKKNTIKFCLLFPIILAQLSSCESNETSQKQAVSFDVFCYEENYKYIPKLLYGNGAKYTPEEVNSAKETTFDALNSFFANVPGYKLLTNVYIVPKVCTQYDIDFSSNVYLNTYFVNTIRSKIGLDLLDYKSVYLSEVHPWINSITADSVLRCVSHSSSDANYNINELNTSYYTDSKNQIIDTIEYLKKIKITALQNNMWYGGSSSSLLIVLNDETKYSLYSDNYSFTKNGIYYQYENPLPYFLQIYNHSFHWISLFGMRLYNNDKEVEYDSNFLNSIRFLKTTHEIIQDERYLGYYFSNGDAKIEFLNRWDFKTICDGVTNYYTIKDVNPSFILPQ